MYNIFLFLHIVLAILLVITIFIQKNSNDGLAGLTSGNQINNVFSNKSSNNFMVKLTLILATLFMLNCILLSNLYYKEYIQPQAVLKAPEVAEDEDLIALEDVLADEDFVDITE